MSKTLDFTEGSFTFMVTIYEWTGADENPFLHHLLCSIWYPCMATIALHRSFHCMRLERRIHVDLLPPFLTRFPAQAVKSTRSPVSKGPFQQSKSAEIHRGSVGRLHRNVSEGHIMNSGI